MIRVVIADDQDLIRGGLRAILDAEHDIEVVAEATDGSAAASAAAVHEADVVLMDIQMPGSDGIDGTREVIGRRPQARVLVITMFDLDEYVFDALRAGASGFLLKTTAPAELAAAVRACHGGELLFAPTVTRRLVEAYVRHPPAPQGLPATLRGLTDRELDVFRALARGRSNAEIAAELHLGEATVKTHVTRILAKLGLRDRVQAVVLAYESGLVARSDSGGFGSA
ncbi:response regulator [Egicoccus sp. AB-alg6-2]|uniref:response regulator n=1 Tax=Egicoccus sp. AB-alg6-2 TaxID=3242692 RepID=UPI00359EDAAA